MEIAAEVFIPTNSKNTYCKIVKKKHSENERSKIADDLKIRFEPESDNIFNICPEQTIFTKLIVLTEKKHCVTVSFHCCYFNSIGSNW